MKDIQAFLSSRVKEGRISWADEAEAAREYGLTFREVELAALTAGMVPERYLRNQDTLSLADQMTLLRGHAAVIGCGGLGGYVIEELARLGIGTMTLVDPDSFEEHNLNRQILCTMDTLGTPKVEAARDRVGRINPAVEVKALREAFSREKGPAMLDGVQVVLDGLDSIPARLELGEVCASLGIPLVHGSIGGWYVQITTQMPGESTMNELYQGYPDVSGIEQTLGNPAFSPALAASLQAAEACKVILKRGHTLSRRLLFFNLLDMEMDLLTL